MKKEPDLALLGFAAFCLGVLFVATSTTTTVPTKRHQTVAVLPNDENDKRRSKKYTKKDIPELKDQLQQCLMIEDYETACEKRDIINSLG